MPYDFGSLPFTFYGGLRVTTTTGGCTNANNFGYRGPTACIAVGIFGLYIDLFANHLGSDIGAEKLVNFGVNFGQILGVFGANF